MADLDGDRGCILGNWKTGEGYVDHGKNLRRWAWEFLRRNPEYRSDWQRFVTLADELARQYSKPEFRQPGEDDGSLEGKFRYHAIIGRAEHAGDERAMHFDPPRFDGETESEWISRVKRGRMQSLEVALGEKWGLAMIADPAWPELPSINCRWLLNPSSVCFPARGGFSPATSLPSLAEHALTEIRAASNKDDAAAVAEHHLRFLIDRIRSEQNALYEMDRNGPKVLLELDLRLPIAEQMRHASKALERRQRKWEKDEGGTVYQRRNDQKWTEYLRSLDAWTSREWKSYAECAADLVAAMNLPDRDGSGIKRATHWIRTGEALRDGQYRNLVGSHETPVRERVKKKKK